MLRYYVTAEQWQPPQRDPIVDRRFWTLLQASFYESFRVAGIGLHRHSVLDYPQISTAAHQDVHPYFSYIPGLAYLLSRCIKFVEDWVRVFYATLYVKPQREGIRFMFQGRPYSFCRATLATLLGLTLH